jgi:hypothetical protein
MNRKQAVLTMLAGAVSWVKIARSAPREDLPPSLKPAAPVADDLQRQVAELTKRVQTLEAAQAQVVGFNKVGNDLVLPPAAGNVIIKAATGTVNVECSKMTVKTGTSLELRSSASAVVEAASNLQLKGSQTTLEASGSCQVKAQGTLEQKAAMITLN